MLSQDLNKVKVKDFPNNFYRFLMDIDIPIEKINDTIKYINANICTNRNTLDTFLSLLMYNIRERSKMKDIIYDVFELGIHYTTSIHVADMTLTQVKRNFLKMASNFNQIVSGFTDTEIDVSGLRDTSDIIVLGFDRATNSYLRKNGINKLIDIKNNADKLHKIEGLGVKRLTMIKLNHKLLKYFGTEVMSKIIIIEE